MDRLDSLTDDTLLQLAGEDNHLAFQALYKRHGEAILQYVYKQVQSHEIAHEVLQDTFLNLWRYRKRLQITSSLRSYLYRGARNNMLSYLRQEKVRKNYAADLTLFIANAADHSNASHQNLNDIQNIIETELTAMPDKWQTAFRLSRQKHLPIRDVAEQMGIEVKTAHNYLTLALGRLRVSLGEFMVFILAFLLIR